MKLEIAAALLQNLAQRAALESGKVALSELEREALEWTVRSLRKTAAAMGTTVPEPAALAPSLDPSAPQPYPLTLTAARLREPQDPDVLLCLDFGTALSKAFARRLSTNELIPLQIGKRAEQEDPLYALQSSMFITREGRLLFGEQAIRASLQEPGRERIDSIKNILAMGTPELGLGRMDLPPALNPSEVPLRYVDVLSMYLAYFTDLATSELVAQGSQRYVRRRVALPAFEGPHAQWAASELRALTARAQILADTFSGRWKEGLSLTDVRAALDSVGQLRAPLLLLHPEDVTEPVAAFASRTLGAPAPLGRRALLALIDVGAGTIDFAMFLRTPGPEGPELVQLIPGTQLVLRKAGNQVDHALRKLILSKAGVQETQPDFPLISTSLQLRIREYKEALFREGRQTFTLVNDSQATVTPEELLASDEMRDLQAHIERKFTEMLSNAFSTSVAQLNLSTLSVILTGGGARLPIVTRVAGQTPVGGRLLHVQIAGTLPAYIQRDLPQLTAEYPQLAVSIGGSSGELPQELTGPLPSFDGMGAHILGRF